MELTSKQRAQLRGLANTIDTIVQVGKDGIGENLIKQVDDALEALGADAVGVNCSCGPDQLVTVIRNLKEATSLPGKSWNT